MTETSKLLSEFVGTFVLVFTIGNVVLSGTGVWGVTAIALSLMIGIYALGAASGAHFNPAVTFAVYLTGKMEVAEACQYAASQILGGLVASGIYVLLYGASVDLDHGDSYTMFQACLVELFYTAMLCFVVLNVACTTASTGNQYFGLAIGLVIVAGGYAVGAISGACFNPAVSIAVDLSSVDKGFGNCGLYLIAQLLGSAVAVALFKLIRPEEFGNPSEKNSLKAKLIAEAVGAYFLMTTIAFNSNSGKHLSEGHPTAWSAAAALTCMVYALGNVSGAHLNPAVTFSIWCSKRGKIDSTTALYYAGSQCVGAILGALTSVAVLGISSGIKIEKPLQTSVVEILMTALLCFTVLTVATSAKPSKDMFGFAIGSVVTVAVFACGSLGVNLNPAMAIGTDFANTVKGGRFGHSIPYTALECAGGLLAAGAFKAIYPEEYAGEKAKSSGGK